MSMNYNHFRLAQLQAGVLYVHDADNRLLRINEPDPEGPAPRFFMVRTMEGNLWRSRYDLPPDLTAELERLGHAEPDAVSTRELREPPRYLAEHIRLLEQHTHVGSAYMGPAYYLPELAAPTGVVTVTTENADLLQSHFPYTLSRLAERSPVVVVAADGAAVAACYSARITEQAAEAGVNTEEAYRGRGYAVQTVRGWAASIRAAGLLPLYSTSWENTASQAVAAKLGAVLYGADFSIT